MNVSRVRDRLECVESRSGQEKADVRSAGAVTSCQQYVEGVKTALTGLREDAKERTERSGTDGQIKCHFQTAWSAGLSMLRRAKPSVSAIPVVCLTAPHSLYAIGGLHGIKSSALEAVSLSISSVSLGPVGAT